MGKDTHKYRSVNSTDEVVLDKEDASLAQSAVWSDGPSARGAKLRACASRCCLTVTFLLLLAGLVYARQNMDGLFGKEKSSEPSGSSSTSSSSPKYAISLRNAYPAIDANYAWPNIVEPSVDTALSIGLTRDHEELCVWSIEYAGAPGAVQRDGCADFSFQFTDCPRLYSIRVTVGEDQVATTAMCKYVRREIRTLTDEDRTRYFAALEVVHRTDLSSGKAVYGNEFRNYEYFTTKHLNANQINDCFPFVGPFHGSNAFLTSHAAFTLELEQSLQSIDPSLTQPYWDFSFDADFYGAEWWKQSDIVGYDFFGPLESGGPSHTINASRWFNFIPVATTLSSSKTEVYNAFGKLTNQFNADGSDFVNRGGSSICGARTAEFAPLPSRLAVDACQALVPQGVTAWRQCLETSVHAYVHAQVGGAWECPVDIGSWADGVSTSNAGGGSTAPDALAAERASFLALNAVNVWKVALSAGLLACPAEECPAEATFLECRCQCWDAAGDAERESLTASEVYGLLSESRVLEFLMEPMGGKRFLSNSGGDGKISFKGLSRMDNNAALRLLLDLACSPAKVGPMATDAASNDPFFWALHLQYDRLWHQGRLAGELGVEGWGYDSKACPGANANDTMPFSMYKPDSDDGGDDGGGSGGDGTSESLPTNEELYAYFSPDNEALPYVYDNFRAFDPAGMDPPDEQDDDAQDAFDDGEDDGGIT